VPIAADLEHAIHAHAKTHGAGGKIFSSSDKAFAYATRQLSFDMPKGQMTHILRHTFASHFMMNGGDLLTLKAILGHASIAMTMRYAHLAQNHLVQAVQFNPLAQVSADLGGQKVDIKKISRR
jgi:site-specific recombinase XerC